MNLRTSRLSPMDLHIQILTYTVPSDQDENAIYTISITYKKKKKWQISRNYKNFEILHKIFLKKYFEIPYLPCRLLLQLREVEKRARAKLMETYLNICIKRQEMLNSLELRLFLKIGKNLGIWLNPPLEVKKVGFEAFPVNVGFFRENKDLFVLTTEKLLNEENSIKKIFSNFSNFFLKNEKKKNKGTIFLLKEKFINNNDYEIKSKIYLENFPSFFIENEKMKIIVIGYKNGNLEIYELKKNNLLEKIFFLENCHNCEINNIKIILSQKIIISSDIQNSLQITEFSKNQKTGFSKKITIFKNLITTFFYVEKRELLFIGDKKGNLHIYKILSKSENYLKLIFTENLKNEEIKNFFLSKNEKYLYISFIKKNIIVYDIGENFNSKPSFVNIWENDFLNKKCFLSQKKKCFITNFENGILCFCDSEKPDNKFYHFLHNGEIFDFFYDEKNKIFFSTGKDFFLRISVFFEDLNLTNFPKKRFLKDFKEDMDFWVFPNCDDFLEKEGVGVERVEERVKVVEGGVDEGSSSSDDDLAGWA